MACVHHDNLRMRRKRSSDYCAVNQSVLYARLSITLSRTFIWCG